MIPEKVKQYADEISKAAYNGEFKEYLSKKYEQFTGVPLELTSNYYPQSRGKLNNSGLESLNANDRGFLTTSNTSIIKKRTGSKSPFKVTGFLSRLNGYISKVSYYGEFTEYIDKYRIFLNKKIDGVSINNIFDEIIPNWNTGKTPWSKYLSQIILEKPNGNVDGFFNSLFSKGASAVLGANISSALKQFGSEFTMAMYSGLGDWSKTLFRGLTNLTKWNEISRILQEQQPYFSERWGSAEVIRSKSGASEVPDWIKKFGILMEINDKSIIISHGWALAQYLAKKNGFGDYWSEGNNKEAARILTDIVLTTQSNSQPMYTSRLRSGYLGSLAKNIFGIFGSDNQIKTEQFKKAFYQGKYAKKRMDSYEKAMNDDSASEEDREFYKSEYTKAKKDFARCKKALADIIPVLLMGGIATTIISEIVARLKGRKEWNEFDSGEFAKDMLLESFVNWMPYVGTISNAIENNSDVSMFTLDQVNEIISTSTDLIDAAKSGDTVKVRKAAIKIAMYLSQLTGFPTKNLYDLIIGSIYQFDKDTATYIRSWTNGYSSSYIKSQYKDALNNNLTGKAKANLKVWSSMYSINLTDSEINEIISLGKNGCDVSPRTLATSYNDENGIEIEMTHSQSKMFYEYYSKASNEVKELLSNSNYQSLDDEYKAKLLQKVYNTYYYYAQTKISGVQSTNKLTQLLAASNGNINVSKLIIGINAISTIKATKNKTRKELILEALNKYKNYSKQEKLLMLYISGLSVSDNNKQDLKRYLSQKGMSTKDIKEYLKLN